MDIDKDLANPSTDIQKYNDGSYRYVDSNGNFDIDKFNREHEQYRERRKKEMRKKLRDKLVYYEEKIPVYHDSLGRIAIDTKDSVLHILDDLLQFRFELNTFTKDDRPFYIGVILILTAVFMYLLYISIYSNKKSTDNRLQIHHIHTVN